MKQRQIRSGEDKLHVHKNEKKAYWILKPTELRFSQGCSIRKSSLKVYTNFPVHPLGFMFIECILGLQAELPLSLLSFLLYLH